MNIDAIKVGMWLYVPPHSDWFMRGETQCSVEKVGRKWVTLRGFRSGKTWQASHAYVAANYLEG